MPQDNYVFISYSTKDLAVVNVVLKVLCDMGVRYWKAPEHIPAGSSYAKEIVSALSNCSLVLVFISQNSQSSQWVEKEIDSALNYNRKIIPLSIDEEPLNGVFRFYLNNVQMIFYRKDPKAAIEELKKHLAPMVSGKQTADKKAMFMRGKAAAPAKAGGQSTRALNNQNDTAASKVVQAPQAVQGTKPKPHPVRMRPVDFSSKNRRPVECRYCGGRLNDVGNGVYRCIECGLESYDDFAAIRQYISQNGPAPVSVLSRALGIPRDIVNDFRDRS